MNTHTNTHTLLSSVVNVHRRTHTHTWPLTLNRWSGRKKLRLMFLEHIWCVHSEGKHKWTALCSPLFQQGSGASGKRLGFRFPAPAYPMRIINVSRSYPISVSCYLCVFTINWVSPLLVNKLVVGKVFTVCSNPCIAIFRLGEVLLWTCFGGGTWEIMVVVYIWYKRILLVTVLDIWYIYIFGLFVYEHESCILGPTDWVHSY